MLCGTLAFAWHQTLEPSETLLIGRGRGRAANERAPQAKGSPRRRNAKCAPCEDPRGRREGEGFWERSWRREVRILAIGEGIVRARELTQTRLFFISVSIPSFSTKHCLSTERKIKSQVCNSFSRNFEKFRESFKNPSFFIITVVKKLLHSVIFKHLPAFHSKDHHKNTPVKSSKAAEFKCKAQNGQRHSGWIFRKSRNQGFHQVPYSQRHNVKTLNNKNT